MDICHLKKSELDNQFQEYKRRIVLRGGVVRDDSRKYGAEMMIHLGESGHDIYRGTVALARGLVKSKGGGQLSIHSIGD